LFEEYMWPILGPTYEVISIFIRSSDDLRRIHSGATASLMQGKNKAGLYFLWPSHFQDSVECPGYVSHQAQLQMMVEMESCGIPTRFPHHSHLYRLLLSKDWMKHMCLQPGFHAPCTTGVSRALAAGDKYHAADLAMKAMRNLQLMQAKVAPCGGNKHVWNNETDDIKGVAKLGFSWEAMDVRRFQSRYQLAEALSALANQRYALLESVMVQEWCEFDVELRLFFIEPICEWDEAKNEMKPIAPKKILYTKFWRIDEEDKLRDFERMPREECVEKCFHRDSKALAEAEKMATTIGNKVLWWLQAEVAEPVPVIRMDFMCHRNGAGKATVHLGELTELGACFLGWEEGPREVFSAVVRSCFTLHGDDKGRQLEYTPQKDKDEDEGDEAGAPNMTYAEAFEHAQKQAAAHNSSNSA